MSELYDKIVSQRGTLKNLGSKIPGFGGYMDGNDRRKADRLLRDHIGEQINSSVTRFTRIENTILDSGGLAHMSKTREVKSKIKAFGDRVTTAAPGYAGLFPKIKIDAEEIDRLYAFDEAQLVYVDRLNEAIDGLEVAAKNNIELEEALNTVEDIAAEANDAFQLREDVIIGLGDKS